MPYWNFAMIALWGLLTGPAWATDKSLLLSLMEPTRQEPGCLRYELLHDQRRKAFIPALLHRAQGGLDVAQGDADRAQGRGG